MHAMLRRAPDETFYKFWCIFPLQQQLEVAIVYIQAANAVKCSILPNMHAYTHVCVRSWWSSASLQQGHIHEVCIVCLYFDQEECDFKTMSCANKRVRLTLWNIFRHAVQKKTTRIEYADSKKKKQRIQPNPSRLADTFKMIWRAEYSVMEGSEAIISPLLALGNREGR